ncbi:hypothetical protein G0Q06_03395 [Puniceicoccales bacterium CK1056]|uniref:Glycoside hydrolase family 42 N-terminal domain-containing protein n=1 Tax=Oceanipulchritudo coccoides TaxID=2706888 RepID=A0A6B2LY01_9BACT|nr:beta-galactosidase [Oceanipulchritudo coccoides]NDV61488.1 hypothetical protein [Oceanipulchritudo coccoides]
MRKIHLTLSILGILSLSAIPAAAGHTPPKSGGDLCLKELSPERYEVTLRGEQGEGRILFDFQKSPLDLSDFSHMATQLENLTGTELDIRLHATSEKEKNDHYINGRYFVAGGEDRLMRILINRDYFPEDHPWTKTFGRIRGLPGGHQSNWRYLDPSQMRSVELKISWKGLTGEIRTVHLSTPHGSGAYTTDKLTPDDLPQPLIDSMGQLIDGKWEGRVTDPDELTADGKRDLEKFTGQPVLKGLSEYGGWMDGPRLTATGHFRVEKVDGKWWFVDPDGYLFWSLGVTGVGGGAMTPTSGREHFFTKLTGAEFWREENFKRGYDFTLANLHRKYGANWREANQQVTFGRMRSWGLNTTGAWSVESVLGHGMVPYTLILHPRLQELGKLDKIPDPFSPEFQKSLVRDVKEAAKSYAGDPWNLGVFIDNELHWGRGIQVAREVIGLDSSVPAKNAMINLFKKKYGKIDSLNTAWETNYKRFKEVGVLPKEKETPAYLQDLAEFCDHHADTYFSQCKAALEEFMPGHLYLGCRFHGAIYDGKNPIVQKAASRHVDVMSYNIYKNSIHDIETTSEVDRPILIGEFHFGTGSHGVWGSGLVPCDSLEDQARLYKTYAMEAAADPNFVGVHWFKWADHPTTGRYDGENYRIGFVNIVDRPYKTLTEAIRDVSSHMYPLRYSTE